MTLQNFISTVLDAVPLPALLQWKDNTFDETEEKQQLQREVRMGRREAEERVVYVTRVVDYTSLAGPG